MYKIIDGILNVLKQTLIVICTLTGAYAAYELIFNMDIPFLFSAVVLLVIISSAWFWTNETPPQPAIPIMIVQDADPVMPQAGGGN